MVPRIPSLPDREDDGIDEEDREFVAALKYHLGPEDEWTDVENRKFVTALLRYNGVDPADIVLIGDETAAYNYRPLLKSEYLAEREYYAELEADSDGGDQ